MLKPFPFPLIDRYEFELDPPSDEPIVIPLVKGFEDVEVGINVVILST